MKTSYLARGGTLTALGVIFIYISTIAPTNKLFLLVMASALIPLGVLATNIKVSIGVYISTSLLSLFIVGFKPSVFLYIIFFGIYGIIKLYIEKINNLYWELLLKFIFFGLCLYTLSFAFNVAFSSINLSMLMLPLPILIVLLVLSFFLYDYALTIFIHRVTRFFVKNS